MTPYILPALFLTVGSCFSQLYYLEARKRGLHTWALGYKALTGLCFCLIGTLLFIRSSTGGLILSGLWLGFLGDLLLSLRLLFPRQRRRAFLGGALTFALGHLCYLSFLLTKAPELLPALLAAAVLILPCEVLAKNTGWSQGSLHLPVLAYLGLEALVSGAALSCLWQSPGLHLAFFALGTLLLLVSDNLLCAQSFGNRPSPRRDRSTHLTYLLAQLILAWCLFFL